MAEERSEQIDVEDGSFESSFHPMFWNPDATAGSWRHTLEFLARSLGD